MYYLATYIYTSINLDLAISVVMLHLYLKKNKACLKIGEQCKNIKGQEWDYNFNPRTQRQTDK